MAQLMLDFDHKRWLTEEYFRSLMSAGFNIENTTMRDPKFFMNFAILAAFAAVTVTQMLHDRDNLSCQALAEAFVSDDRPLLFTICKDYEGEAPTARQKNPHPADTLAFATWIRGGSVCLNSLERLLSGIPPRLCRYHHRCDRLEASLVRCMPVKQ